MESLRADQLAIGDEFADGDYVVDVYNDDYGTWLQTDGPEGSTMGYVESYQRYDVVNYADAL